MGGRQRLERGSQIWGWMDRRYLSGISTRTVWLRGRNETLVLLPELPGSRVGCAVALPLHPLPYPEVGLAPAEQRGQIRSRSFCLDGTGAPFTGFQMSQGCRWPGVQSSTQLAQSVFPPHSLIWQPQACYSLTFSTLGQVCEICCGTVPAEWPALDGACWGGDL